MESRGLMELSTREKLYALLVTYERSGLMPPKTKQCYLLTFTTVVNW